MTFEKAVYVTVRYGAKTSDLEDDFIVDDVAWRVMRCAVADFWNMTPMDVDELRDTPLLNDMLGYMAGKAKAQS